MDENNIKIDKCVNLCMLEQQSEDIIYLINKCKYDTQLSKFNNCTTNKLIQSCYLKPLDEILYKCIEICENK